MRNKKHKELSSVSNIGTRSARAPANVKRMSVSLSGDTARMLETLAETQGITQNEVLRKAIATEAYLQQEIMQGSKVLLQRSDKEICEVVFR
jgi:hypothetical protein